MSVGVFGANLVCVFAKESPYALGTYIPTIRLAAELRFTFFLPQRLLIVNPEVIMTLTFFFLFPFHSFLFLSCTIGIVLFCVARCST